MTGWQHTRLRHGDVRCGKVGMVVPVLTNVASGHETCSSCREPVPPVPLPGAKPLTGEQVVWNVVVPVVATVLADTPEAALSRFSAALRHAGFEPADGLDDVEALIRPFRADPETEPDL